MLRVCSATVMATRQSANAAIWMARRAGGAPRAARIAMTMTWNGIIIAVALAGRDVLHLLEDATTNGLEARPLSVGRELGSHGASPMHTAGLRLLLPMPGETRRLREGAPRCFAYKIGGNPEKAQRRRRRRAAALRTARRPRARARPSRCQCPEPYCSPTWWWSGGRRSRRRGAHRRDPGRTRRPCRRSRPGRSSGRRSRRTPPCRPCPRRCPRRPCSCTHRSSSHAKPSPRRAGGFTAASTPASAGGGT